MIRSLRERNNIITEDVDNLLDLGFTAPFGDGNYEYTINFGQYGDVYFYCRGGNIRNCAAYATTPYAENKLLTWLNLRDINSIAKALDHFNAITGRTFLGEVLTNSYGFTDMGNYKFVKEGSMTINNYNVAKSFDGNAKIIVDTYDLTATLIQKSKISNKSVIDLADYID